MPSHIKNAVKMIQPFCSENATVEKAKSFWNAFERATVGLDEQLRLSAFRECLKGKTGENWRMYSQINDFETLRTRFHNQFICQTPSQMVERLGNTKHTRGMSIEVWTDVVSRLCDAAQCYDPQMRYQYFLAELWNREWKAALSTTMVNSIPHDVAVLLYKNMHIPAEHDDFADMEAKPRSDSAPMEKMMTLMEQTQGMLLQQQQATRATTSGGPSYITAAYDMQVGQSLSPTSVPMSTGNVAAHQPIVGVRPGPDLYTQEGRIVCGRCHILGCSRITCRRNSATCGNCRAVGHTTVECTLPMQSGSGRPSGGGGGRQGSRACYMC
ncbi:hypothetical protein PC129_g19609 [Phytophthora cactorum]|uniref:Retrotransposon gag domain-containing protein n=1 Tax=Phytophthora cactorum TaxID=29920 RepID=A0A8T0YLT2_9STRA|nr:hypothetical protein PC112_g20584 [Phytophthora cactorum]KAG2833865.1 hypothetical protein PC113_g20503 [Phytophthora cactorum]KAG2879184.1 hypothetical protein PC114_g22700 [Phytophthora cactorum]KAG2898589.1 hypothetical protein PC117_g22476 [Phytophthora cactorum]KAG2961771.1 hypothetical protein PC118_g21788 [Phytophthora cactorum]